jgi:acyl transferase domain-containing protein
MSCRYAGGANSPNELWKLLAEGRQTWSEVPPDRFNWNSFYHPSAAATGGITQKGGHFINQDLAAFDPAFFGMSTKEAETLDPIQRIVLETSWEAVENAGIPMNKLRGSDTAVFSRFSRISWLNPHYKLMYSKWPCLGMIMSIPLRKTPSHYHNTTSQAPAEQ